MTPILNTIRLINFDFEIYKIPFIADMAINGIIAIVRITMRTPRTADARWTLIFYP